MALDTELGTVGDLIWATISVLTRVMAGSAILLATIAAYRLYFHPLARVPGPSLAAVSGLWQAYQVRNGRMLHEGKVMHRKYGPVIRVGPNEVWCNSEDAFRSIYSVGNGFKKSDFYLATALTRPRIDWSLQPHFPDTLDLLSERDIKRYRLQRRLIGPVYHNSNLVKHEAAVDAVIASATAALTALDGAEVDLKEWMHMIAVECLGAVVLSWSPSMLRKGTDWGTSAHSYQGWRRKSVFGLFPLMVKLEVWNKSLGRVFANLWGVTFTGVGKFRPFFPDVQKRVSGRVNMSLRPKPQKDDRKDLLRDLIELHKEKPAFSETYLRRMAISNFGAGHETMAATLTAIVAMVATHADVQRRVADEAREANSTAYTAAVQLVHTQAAIKEAKRLHPVLGMSLPRTVPSPGIHLHGHFLPPGMTVGCNPAALHRNPEICIGGSDPEIYDPTRWLDSEAARRMERCSLAWGGGSRTCPGRHLAELVLFKVVPAVFRAFEVRVVMPEEEGPSYFLSMLTGVKAQFLPRDDTNRG